MFLLDIVVLTIFTVTIDPVALRPVIAAIIPASKPRFVILAEIGTYPSGTDTGISTNTGESALIVIFFVDLTYFK